MGSLYIKETRFGIEAPRSLLRTGCEECASGIHSSRLGKFTRFLIRIQGAEKSIPTFEKAP